MQFVLLGRLTETLIILNKEFIMKSIFLRMGAVALTLSLGLAAGSANAATLTFNGWTPGTGGSSSVFGDAGVAPGLIPNSFIDWLYFTLPSNATGSGGASTISNVSVSGFNVIFDEFTILDTVSNVTVSGVTGLVFSGLSFVGGAVPGSYSLKIAGHQISASDPGSYGGTVTAVTTVPEPETYAMLLAGLGLMGFSARRRKNNA